MRTPCEYPIRVSQRQRELAIIKCGHHWFHNYVITTQSSNLENFFLTCLLYRQKKLKINKPLPFLSLIPNTKPIMNYSTENVSSAALRKKNIEEINQLLHHDNWREWFR